MKKYYEFSADFETTTIDLKSEIKQDNNLSRNKQIINYYDENNIQPIVYSWVATFDIEYKKDIILKKEFKNIIGKRETTEVIHYYGFDLKSFIDFVNSQDKKWKIFFHNLKGFDGTYILPHIAKTFFNEKPNIKPDEWDKKEKDKRQKLLNDFYGKKVSINKPLPFEYSTIIEKGKKIYNIECYLPSNKNRKKINILSYNDNLLLFNTSIDEIGKQLVDHHIKLGMNELEAKRKYSKQEINYFKSDLYNSLQEMEKDQNGKRLEYLLQDGYILNRFRLLMSDTLEPYEFPRKRWEMTAGATAYKSWIYIFGNKLKSFYKDEITKVTLKNGMINYKFGRNKLLSEKRLSKALINDFLPTKWLKENDNFEKLFSCYFGGISKVNETFRGIILNDIDIYDIVSSYPDTMNSDLLCPYGNPVEFKDGDLHIYKLYVKNDIINKYGLPFLREAEFNKDDKIKTNAEYNKVLKEGTTYYLTNYELDRFIKYYNPSKNDYELRVLYSFKGKPFKYFFGEYIDHWYKLKDESKKLNNVFLKNFAKIMLNSLYGKFGTKRQRTNYHYDKDKNEYIEITELSDNLYYLPIAIYITACARMKLVDMVDTQYNEFDYCDTDSIFIRGGFKVDQSLLGSELGKWEKENKHSYKIVVRRAKQYYAECTINGKNCKECKKPMKLAFAGINFLRTDDKMSSENITEKQRQYINNLTHDDFIFGKIIGNQLTPLNYNGIGKILFENEKEIPPIWHYPPMQEQIYITKEQFLNNYKKSST